MSFSKLLIKSVDERVNIFLEEVSKKFNIDKTSLRNIWDSIWEEETASHSNSQVVQQTQPLQVTNELLKLGKTELIAHCKAKGLKTTGTKQELVDRLSGNVVTKANVKSKSKAAPQPVEPKVIKKLVQSIEIKRNSFGNYEHTETHLLFNKDSHEVIGKQDPGGDVLSLTDEDIETCNKYKFKYIVPENLNTKSSNKVVIEELGEDELDETQIGEAFEEEAEEEFLEEEEYIEEEEDFEAND